jgi:hypothetical protein
VRGRELSIIAGVDKVSFTMLHQQTIYGSQNIIRIDFQRISTQSARRVSSNE